jgi:NAD-dependent DNA ligase
MGRGKRSRQASASPPANIPLTAPAAARKGSGHERGSVRPRILLPESLQGSRREPPSERRLPLAGMVLVISGAVPGFHRDAALEALAQAGATVADSASAVKSADALLVAGQTLAKVRSGSGTSKTRVAELAGTPIVPIASEEEFRQLLSGSHPQLRRR